MASHFPHASRSSHLPSILLSVAAACFWLVVAFQISISGRIRPQYNFVFIFVQRSVHRPKQWCGITPTRSVKVARPPEYPPHRDHGLLVGCCMPSSNGGHLSPEPRPSLCFLMRLFSAPQTGKPVITPPNPTMGALSGTYRKQQRHWLVAPTACPWRERVNTTEG
jgi:hypothetical protein